MLRHFSDQVEPYSIDEQFIDVSGSLTLFGGPIEIAKAIQDKVWQDTGVYVRVGIGDTKVKGKIACDLWARKNTNGIFTLTPELLPSMLWPRPIGDLFMVGRRMTAHFSSMGLLTWARSFGALHSWAATC
ncbi:Y-family DNA polymerase [Paenibacillus odorifer]|uniref:Y-family DNA polymerase n=1 Tax=Paenibacillus odorifer TaxID=189426 RepID=UPI0020C9723E|nr:MULTISPECIES: hypothetical protein [Paenibacillus]